MLKHYKIDFSDKLFPGHLEHLKDLKVKCIYYSGEELVMFLRTLQADPKVVYGIDIETYALPEYDGTYGAGLMAVKSQIRTVQIYDGQQVVVMDFMAWEGNNLLQYSRPSIEHLCSFLREGRFVAHNAQFEVNHFTKLLELNGTPAELEIHCTMNAYRLIRQAIDHKWDEYGVSLQEVSKVVLGINVDKDIQHDRWRVPGELDAEQKEYCARDAVLPMLLLCELWKNLKDFEMLDFYKLQTRLYNVLGHMHLFGAPIDVAAHANLIELWKAKLLVAEQECFRLLNKDKGFADAEACWQVVQDKVAKKQQKKVAECMLAIMVGQMWSDPLDVQKLQIELAKVASFETEKNIKTAFNRAAKNLEEHLVNPGSDKQLSNWVKANVDKDILNEWPITEASQKYVDDCIEKVIPIDSAKIQLKMSGEAFDEVGELEIIKPIQEYKKYSKLISTYGEGLQKFYVQAPWNGGGVTVHGQYSTCFTETGRLSTSKPTVQNAPRDKEFRKIYSTRAPGYTFLSADFSQIELRVQAELTQDPVMLQVYNDGLDIHDTTAEAMLWATGQTRETANEEVWEKTRDAAKNVNFACQYGGGANAVKKGGRKTGMRLPLETWRTFVDAYRSKYHTAYQWQLDQAAHCKETLKVRIPGGKLAALHPDYAFTQSLNFPIQGAAAVVEQLTLCELYKVYCERRDLDFRITKSVHDARDLDVRDEHLDEVKNIVEACMERAWLQVFPEATIRKLIGAKAGPNWGELKKI